MLFNVMIKEITGEEAKENGLGLSAGLEAAKGLAPKDSLQASFSLPAVGQTLTTLLPLRMDIKHA